MFLAVGGHRSGEGGVDRGDECFGGGLQRGGDLGDDGALEIARRLLLGLEGEEDGVGQEIPLELRLGGDNGVDDVVHCGGEVVCRGEQGDGLGVSQLGRFLCRLGAAVCV